MRITLEEEDRKAIASEIVKELTILLRTSEKHKREDSIMNVGTLSEYLNVSRDWIYKEVARNQIPVVRTGRAIRFRKIEIDDWLEKISIKPVATNPAARYFQKKGARDS